MKLCKDVFCIKIHSQIIVSLAFLPNGNPSFINTRRNLNMKYGKLISSLSFQSSFANVGRRMNASCVGSHQGQTRPIC